MIPEIQQNRTAQETIPAGHPARLFGETVEHETARDARTCTPEPIVVKRSAPVHGLSEYDCKHYVLGSTKYPNLFKTGSTNKSVDERLRKITVEQPPGLGPFVRATHHYEGHFEHEIRLKLDTWGYKKPPVDWGTKGCEFRVGSFGGILDAIDAVKKAHETNSESATQSLRLRREAAEVEGLEVALAAKRLKLATEQFQLEKAKGEHEFQLEKARRDYELDWEGRKLELDLKKRAALS